MRDYFGKDNILNTLTLRTEGSKSATLTACRGLGIDIDTAQAIADMIPFERGANYSLNDCFYGNEEKGRKPVTDFIHEVEQFPRLKEVMFMIEGLICGRGIHASAVYIFDDGYLSMNGRMRAPNGEYITAFNMGDSDAQGALKFDCLTIAALDKIHITMDMLCEAGLCEQQSTIKATYDKYIHPDVLDYTDPAMWQMLNENALIDAFQFDTPQGMQVLKTVHPQSILQLAVANTLMRLMAPEGEEQPADTYAKHKANISLWYEEMRSFGLTEDEIKILEPHLLPLYGVAESQEAVMKLSMDPKIAGFTVAEANKIRKSIAKKKPKLLAESQTLFYEKGRALGSSDKLLDYVWNVQFKKSFGYSFSLNHTLPYSCICLQEMNLAAKYPKIYWNAACLTMNASADEEMENSRTTQYGKVAKALGSIQKQGQELSLPFINRVELGFAPSQNTNKISFSLKGISGVGDGLARAIISNRPYESLQDFCEKMQHLKETRADFKCGDSAIIMLIKAGCFDELENKSREEIMKDFLKMRTPPKTSLTMRDIITLDDMGLLTPEQRRYEKQLYRFKMAICQPQNFAFAKGKSPATHFYKIQSTTALDFFYSHYVQDLVEGKDYLYDDEGILVAKRGSIEKVLEKLTRHFKENTLQNPDIIAQYNEHKLNEQIDTHAQGTLSRWEMESLCFYYHEHELAHVDKERYSLSSFADLPETPVVVEYRKRGNRELPRFQLNRICGTVLDKNKNKHLISLLTTDGVVDVKFYKGQYNFYDKQISEVNEDGSKSVLEKSWFTRGNKVLITGIRRGDQFAPCKYADSAYRHTVQLIKEVRDDGSVTLQSERVGYDNE